LAVANANQLPERKSTKIVRLQEYNQDMEEEEVERSVENIIRVPQTDVI
jgi:hypothetical protein